jgi:hypothetical protein
MKSWLCLGLALGLSAAGCAHADDSALARALSRAAPGADPGVLELAVSAAGCAQRQGIAPAQRLAVIDYSLPSTRPRLWVFDLAQGKLLYQELVAHGRRSGDNYARSFSNEDGSLASSLGLFRTLEPYEGHNGYSLRLEGLEPQVNDHALARNLVIHGAAYVNPLLAVSQGRIGRSWGCPAVRLGVIRPLVEALRSGQLLFSYYPDRKWLASSRFLRCDGKRIADSR